MCTARYVHRGELVGLMAQALGLLSKVSCAIRIVFDPPTILYKHTCVYIV